MDEELKRLIAEAERTARTGERLSEAFARELADVLKDTERYIARVLATAVENRTAALSVARASISAQQIRAILRASGYDVAVMAATEQAATTLIGQHLTHEEVRALVNLTLPKQQALDALREFHAASLMAKGDEAAIALWRSVNQAVMGARPIADILEDLADALDQTAAETRTMFDTQVSVFGRQIEDTATAHLGDDQPFLYVGPIDDVTREFCLQRVGKVYSRKAIDEMDNGQLPNTFQTAGGVNCRHSWVAVESAELRAMMDTGQTVEPYGDDVANIRQRKIAKREAKAAAKAKKDMPKKRKAKG